MYSDKIRLQALDLLAEGTSVAEVVAALGVGRTTVTRWRASGDRTPRQRRPCPRCDGAPLDGPGYSRLLGFYLGDGHLTRQPRQWVLSIACDARYVRIIDEVRAALVATLPAVRIHHIERQGATLVQAGWMHWPCLFPQHGRGRKHERRILLEDWQRTIIETHVDGFLQGLLHSDGSRVRNWATRPVAGRQKRYEYPRWQFVNHSDDIRDLYCWALDLVAVPWRRSSWKTISVSRREAVDRLDSLVGLKA